METGGSRSLRVAWAMVGLAASAGAMALANWTPSGDPATTVCLLRRFAGMPCPTCGLTRAAAALARGDLVGATRLHPLAVPLAVQAVALWGAWGLAAWGRVRPLPPAWIARIALANAALLGIAWLVRL